MHGVIVSVWGNIGVDKDDPRELRFVTLSFLGCTIRGEKVERMVHAQWLVDRIECVRV